MPFLLTFENLSKVKGARTGCSQPAALTFDKFAQTRLPKQSNKHSTFFTSASDFTFLVAKQDDILSQSVCARGCSVFMYVVVESLCTSRSIDIRKLTTSKRVASSRSSRTAPGATPHSEVGPVQERPGLRKCWQTFREIPNAFQRQHSLLLHHACMLQSCRRKKNCSNFERELKGPGK